MQLETNFYKGPITACEYIKENYILIGYGPYLSLLNDTTYNEVKRYLALKYRVIHKIVKFKDSNLICVFGQKSFILLELTQENDFIELSNLIELDDWIFDIYWNSENNLTIICAHNQCISYNIDNKTIEKLVYCNQKCMLYSAKILNIKIQSENQIIIASGTIYNQILIWHSLDGSILMTLDGHQGVIFNIEYSYETNKLFSVSDDRSINVWNLSFINNELIDKKETNLITRFYGHDARVWKCASFIDTQSQIEYLCSIGEDLNCCLWNVSNKTLVYKFDSIKKGSKNIWSLCINAAKLTVYTGWHDGCIRKFELKNYLINNKQEETKQIDHREKSADHFEWNIKKENEKDFIRNIQLINKRIICCTNLGCLYLIETNLNEVKNQRLLLKNSDLANFSTMSAIKLENNLNKWCLAIGTSNGSIYLIDFKLSNEFNSNQFQIDIIKPELDPTQNNKICNLIWHTYENRYYLLVCFSFQDGLTHLYELIESKLKLIACLQIPETKHRWFTSYSLLINDSIHYLICGDKCGNLHLFEIGINTKNLLNKPTKSFKNLTKENSSISAVYLKKIDPHNYLIICCCKDGWYRLFDFIFDSEDDEYDEISQLPTIKFINKYQINSFIDIIVSFIFEFEFQDDEYFNLENSLSLAVCFYGDKFLLWSFHLNRALFEIRY